MKLSEHYSMLEATQSNTAITKGINNDPNESVLSVLRKTAVGMERVRALLGNRPINIHSWYRCPALNTAVGGVHNSQHLTGEAVDFVCPSFGRPRDIAHEIVGYKELIRFDQLILEHNWIHISFAILSGKPRGQVLSLTDKGGYVEGLKDLIETHY
jgi:zinc D-Ala-D-Ala carboxypeptidase